MFTRSSNRGKTWSEAVAVSEIHGAFNYFPWLSCAPNGRIDLVYYSRPLSPTNHGNDVFCACSPDGGVTWSRATRVSEITSRPYVPKHGGETYIGLGDYISCASDNTSAYIVWGDTRMPPGVADPPGNAYVWFSAVTAATNTRAPMP